MLYPVELRALLKPGLPQITGLELVGVERFELPTSWSQTRRATRLRYTPSGRVSYPAHLLPVNEEGSGVPSKKVIDLPAALKSDIKAPSFF